MDLMPPLMMLVATLVLIGLEIDEKMSKRKAEKVVWEPEMWKQ